MMKASAALKKYYAKLLNKNINAEFSFTIFNRYLKIIKKDIINNNMKNLASKIYRQRLIIEGLYTIEIKPSKLRKFMKGLSVKLGMTIIYGPIIKNLAEKINPIHKGFEGVMIWAESGTSVYTWENENFFTVDIYTCKRFDVNTAVNFTKEFFGAKEIVFKSI